MADGWVHVATLRADALGREHVGWHVRVANTRATVEGALERIDIHREFSSSWDGPLPSDIRNLRYRQVASGVVLQIGGWSKWVFPEQPVELFVDFAELPLDQKAALLRDLAGEPLEILSGEVVENG